MKIRVSLLLLFSLLLLVTACSSYRDDFFQGPYSRGKRDAESEIAMGNLAIESYGYPAPWSGRYTEVLESRYGIEDRTVAFCVVDNDTKGHAKGFNEVMRAEIQKRYGKDALEKAAEGARKEYEKNKEPNKAKK